MCGRYALTLPPEAVRQVFRYREQPNFPPRYNIAPTQPVPVVVAADGGRSFRLMRWGFLPGFAKDARSFPLVINIRAETVREKPSFRAAFARRRGLMPADGFYEWQPLGPRQKSRPFLLRRPDREVFAFAALHETWCSSDGGAIDTVALLNTTASGVLATIHGRSPVILPPECWEAWLDPATPAGEAAAMLRPPPDDALEMVPIGWRINRVSEDGPEVQAPPKASAGDSAARGTGPTRGGTAAPDQGSLF